MKDLVVALDSLLDAADSALECDKRLCASIKSEIANMFPAAARARSKFNK